jgi:TonB family protein
MRRLDDNEINHGGSAGAHPGAGEAESLPAMEASEYFSGVFMISSVGKGKGQTDSGNGREGGAGGKGSGLDRSGMVGGNGTGSGRGSGGVASFGGQGAGSGVVDGDGIAGILRSIRRQIEQNKVYPDAARREGIQGTVQLRFRIAADGSVEAVEILRSSGSAILDEASRETLRRGAPYPVVRGWIRLPLSYHLDH